LPARFNPTRFDPHAWIALARAAGQRYMVFTTKHHDGFCMFDSDYTSYKITRTPYGKDIVKQLSDACHADAMPLGFYYSPPDMNHPAFRDTSKLSATNYRGEPERQEWPLYLEYMGLQPATLINNRLGVPGDFATPEQFIPRAIPVKGVRLDSPNHAAADKLAITVPRPEDFQPWESCMTINNTWAYRPKDRDFKSSDALIRALIEVISRGGNLLLDVGPQPDGQIQPEFVERLEAVGCWTRSNAAAIYGSTYGPIQGQPSCRTTARGASIFVFVMDSTAREVIVTRLDRPVSQVRLVATGKPLTFHPSGKGIRIPLDKALWEQGIPVLELR
jgi:alpha-L-fucosidase